MYLYGSFTGTVVVSQEQDPDAKVGSRSILCFARAARPRVARWICRNTSGEIVVSYSHDVFNTDTSVVGDS
jgi:hypothetical protein